MTEDVAAIDAPRSCRLYSAEAERACLGAAILDNTFLRGPLNCLSVSDFGLSANQELFALMLQSHEDGLEFDILTLVESLQQKNRLEAIGEVAYLDRLTDGVVLHSGLIKRHAETVIRFSRLRQIQKLADRIGHLTGEPGMDPDQLLEHFAGTVDALQAGYDLDGNLLPYEPHPSSRRPEILTLSQVEAKEVDWLWKPYLANGMLAMLSGDPGAGKTYIALAIAAAITTGRVPCTGEHREPAVVLCLTSERIKPRSQYVLRAIFIADQKSLRSRVAERSQNLPCATVARSDREGRRAIENHTTSHQASSERDISLRGSAGLL